MSPNWLFQRGHRIGLDKARGIIRGELADQRAAAARHLLLIERIKPPPPDLTHQHQSSFFQALEMMTNGRLFDFATERIDEVIDA